MRSQAAAALGRGSPRRRALASRPATNTHSAPTPSDTFRSDAAFAAASATDAASETLRITTRAGKDARRCWSADLADGATVAAVAAVAAAEAWAGVGAEAETKAGAILRFGRVCWAAPFAAVASALPEDNEVF